MSNMKPELSKNSEYWIPRHRYYELKHFCLQYSDWKKVCESLDGLSKGTVEEQPSSSEISDPTARCAEKRAIYQENMRLLELAAEETDSVLGNYILQGVVSGLSYTPLKARLEIPCCKDTYYDLYRRFFWILDRMRM